MKLKLVRGVVADLTTPEKNESASGRVGERAIRLHRDLSNAAKNGDDVLIGGELHDEVVHVFALKNFSHKKMCKIDFTFHILGAALGGFFALVGLILTDSPTGGNTWPLIMTTVGVAIVFVPLRRMLRIIKLNRWVDQVTE